MNTNRNITSRTIFPNENALILEERSIQDIWATQAQCLIELEVFGLAKELILESTFHAKAFDDKLTNVKCLHSLAYLYYYERDVDNAVRVIIG